MNGTDTENAVVMGAVKRLGMPVFALISGLAVSSATAAMEDSDNAIETSFGASIGAVYSDNIVYSVDPKNDTLGYLGAKAVVSKKTGSHQLRGTVDGFFTQHREFKQEEVDDYQLSAGWNHLPSKQAEMGLTLSYAEETHHRFLLDHPQSDERTEVSNLVATADVARKLDDWKLSFNAAHRRMNYRDITNDGDQINRDDEDRDESDLTLGVERPMAGGGLTPSLSMSYKRIDYAQNTDDFDLERSSDVYMFKLGLGLNSYKGLNGSVSIRSYYRDFKGNDFDSLRSFVGSAYVSKSITKAMDFSLTLFRTFNEFNLAFSPGFYANGAILGANHSVSAQGKISGSASYIGYDFINDTDDIKDVILSANYTHKISSNLNAMLKYTYTDRDSESVVFNSFDENRVELVLNFGSIIPSLSAREWFYWVGLENTPN